MNEFKIAVVAATKDEYFVLKSLLKDRLKNFQEIKKNQVKNPFPYFIGNLNYNQINIFDNIETSIICINSGFGKLNAVSALTLILERYDIDFVVNFGACGSLCDKLKIGDLVIPKLIYESSYISINNLLNNKNSLNKKDNVSVGLNKTEALIHKELKDKFIEIKEVNGFCADMDIDLKEKREFLNRYFNSQICDWESFSIRKISHMWKIPSLIFRVVSDYADENFLIDYKNNIEQILIKAAKILIDNILTISCKICISVLNF